MSPDPAVLVAGHRLGWPNVATRPVRFAVVAAAVAVVVEASTYLRGWPGAIRIGDFEVTASVVPLFAAAVVGGRRRSGTARSADSAKTFWVLAVMSLAVAATALSAERSAATVVGLVVIAFLEEFMYRGAIPALAGFLLVRLGLGVRASGLGGLAAGGLCFVLLPGHLAQWSDAGVVPFASFAFLAALAVWRTGALYEAAVLHAVINTVNIGRLDGGGGDGVAGAVLLGALMILFVIAYLPAGRSVDLVVDVSGDEPSLERAWRKTAIQRRSASFVPAR